MKISIAPRALRAPGLVALMALAACGDGSTGPGGTPFEPPVTVAPSAMLACRADVRAGVVECAPGAGAQSAAAAAEGARLQQHVLGGQGTYVRLASSGVSYAGETFSFNVSVQNLLTLAMATADGATRTDEGVRVLFHTAPVATGGTGSITVANATGTAAFTAANQPYFQYGGKIGGVDQGDLGADGILASGETSSNKTWQLNVPATVTTFTFTLLVSTETPPGAMETIAPQVTGVSPATLVPGSTATLTGYNFHATPASNTVTIGGVAATVTGGTGTTQLNVTVPCAASGSVGVQVTATGRKGNAFAHPLQAPQRTIAAGQMTVVPAAEAGCSELPAAGGAASYVVAVYNTSTSPFSTAAFQLSADADGTAPAPAAAPAARPRMVRAPLGGAPGLDGQMALARERRADDAHQRLLEINRRENDRLRTLFRNDPRMGARRNVVVNADPPPATRTIRVFNLNSGSCSNYTSVNATRVYYNGKIAIYEDDAAPAGLKASANAAMQSYYNAIGDQFNADMEPIIRNNYGDPLLRDAVTDNNGVLVALFTTALAGTGAAGFVVSCDQYPNGVGNESSNFGEYFYAILPTVVGTGYSSDTPDSWYRTIRSTFIHETKHVASQAARVAGGRPFESSWLEEGTARHSEELWARTSIYNVAWKGNTGYGSAGSPGSIYCDVRPNTAACTATNPRRPSLNMYRHFSSLYTFMDTPEAYSPFGTTAAGGSSWYATSWSLVRYAIDRYGASDAAFLSALTGSSSTGTTNLAAAAGVPLDQLMGGWAVSLYMDDYPGLAGASADTQMPTWNFDGIFAGLNTDFPGSFTSSYPLAPTALSFGSFGTASVPSIVGGGVSYFVLSGTQLQPQLLRLTGAGGGSLPSSLRVAIGRIQ